MSILPIASSCPLCHGKEFRCIHKKKKWRYLQCLMCGLVSLSPRPSQQVLLASYESYLSSKFEEIRNWKRMMMPLILKSAVVIESAMATGKGRLLDIGCGYGFFLKEMKCRGWQVEGIEVALAGMQFAKNELGLNVYSRPLEELNLPEHSYDVITLFYVIEHVYDPVKLLAEVKRVLKPGGFVVLRWPHSTPIVKLLGPISRKLDLYHTPFHLYDFSPKTIAGLLIKSGFRQPKTSVGGYTKPTKYFSRLFTTVFGQLGEALFAISDGRLLLPGLSKMTIAKKPLFPPSRVHGSTTKE